MEGRAEIRVAAPLSGLYAASSHEDHAAVYKLRPLSTSGGHCLTCGPACRLKLMVNRVNIYEHMALIQPIIWELGPFCRT